MYITEIYNQFKMPINVALCSVHYEHIILGCVYIYTYIYKYK